MEKKPRKKKGTSNVYFTQETENAILEYVGSQDQDFRNKLYKEKIENALFKLTQNLIHTYKYYYTDGESIEDLQQEVIAFILSKMHLYKSNKGKAYSYFGTIAKRYLIYKNDKNYKKLQGKENIDNIHKDDFTHANLVEAAENPNDSLNIFIDLYVKYIDKNINKLFIKDKDKKTVGAIVELFRKRENLDVFNKKALYIYIRDMSDVETSQITKIIKKLKVIYIKLYNEYYREGDLVI